jgi:ABC-type methionine transport system permease subunit
MLNLYLMAFGLNWNVIYRVCIFSDIVYGIEILLTFITSYKDDIDTNEQVYSLRRILINYILHGPFILDLVATIPFTAISN